MTRKLFILMAILGLGLLNANAQTMTKMTAMNDMPEMMTIGDSFAGFSVKDFNGKDQTFKQLKGKSGAVLVFVSAQCPVVQGYNERLKQLAKDLQEKNITLMGINSNSTETVERIKAHAAEKEYNFPILIDKGNVIADKFGATATPEVFFIDANDKLVYHGAIDNSRLGDNITENYLREAIDTNLSGKQIEKSVTKSFGCGIKRVEVGSTKMK